ncbi:MAG: DeoR family transcriptional regulator [Candidatus Pacebacteria bacterium]|jgi:hypothetical protein|nr:DeoR family transcriptional regulator [Candidatus Paceibacterota bacterium]
MDYKKDNNQRGLMSHRSSNGMETFSITLPKKCERLATAIYLVTNFLSDTEPMKPRLRALSLDFVRDAALLKSGGYGVEANVLEALRTNILETLSLLELAFMAGLISEMNFTVLKREYATLRDTIEVKKASRESRTDSILGDTFFGTSFHAEESPLKSPASSISAPKIEEPRSTNSAPKMSLRMSDRNTEKVTPEIKTHATVRATTNVLKESRRARILKLIKDNREVTIKDIANHFPDLSEKTIQRELVLLVETNVLKKSGERRWSKYTLV